MGRYLLLLLLLAGVAVAGPSGTREGDAVFQTSTISALSVGVYDGSMTFRELKEHGNFGLGTLEGLDGELVGVDGRFYHVNAEGVVAPVPDEGKTPFAVVKQFRTDRTLTLTETVDAAGLAKLLDGALPSRNVPYAIRIDGQFSSILLRSVPRQSKPYPPLAQALEGQRTFPLRDVAGTLVGFRTPPYLQAVNAPGYHFHFLTADRKAGGHVLACEMRSGTVLLDEARDLEVSLPDDPEYDRAELGP
jgi:acetolactate decarboxylase